MQVDLWDVLQVVTPVLLAGVGWGVRLIWSEIRALRSEQKEYVRERVCQMHREDIQRQLEELKKGAPHGPRSHHCVPPPPPCS